tara:strand:- start:250 stop:450 length:201 start_codon:yes stop_codon:yes gene_type:complete
MVVVVAVNLSFLSPRGERDDIIENAFYVPTSILEIFPVFTVEEEEIHQKNGRLCKKSGQLMDTRSG